MQGNNAEVAPSVESHPFKPFLPSNAKLLMLGTFPPSPKRWCMEFYYPNFTNDMWRIFGICFFGNKEQFVRREEKRFDLDAIISFLNDKGIALFDTATRVVRTKNTASDKDLKIVEQTDFNDMLCRLPECKAVATAGQLATSIFALHYNIVEPKVGGYTEFTFEGRQLRLYRMPSSSRAYPMRTEDKAEIYQTMFDYLYKQQ